MAIASFGWSRCENEAGVLGEIGPGEAGGFFVECLGLGRRAYLKPLKNERAHRRAAREKIAADLAFDLDITVPPVVLATRTDASEHEETEVSLSLVAFPKQYSWGTIRPQAVDPTTTVGAFVRESLSKHGAEGLAFDTWLGQTDHGDHPHNIVFGYDPADPGKQGSLVFLDYSYSMGIGGGWNDRGWRSLGVVPFPSLMIDRLDVSVLEATIAGIEALTTIEEVVRRVPPGHMPPEEGEVVVEGLRGRQGLLRGLLAPYVAAR